MYSSGLSVNSKFESRLIIGNDIAGSIGNFCGFLVTYSRKDFPAIPFNLLISHWMAPLHY